MREVDRNSDEGHELYDMYAKRIWIHDFPTGSGRFLAGTDIPPLTHLMGAENRLRDSMKDAMLAYEEGVESFHEWAASVHDVRIIN